MRANRLAGHILPNEGRIFGNGIGYPQAEGVARCSCGATSEVLQSANARKAWHRAHKDAVRNGEVLPRAVLFDVDGTLALRNETDPNVRHFAAWDRVGEDLPNGPVIELARLVAESGRYKLIVMSGRDEVCRWQTEMWLTAQGVTFDDLHMRPHKDNRPDDVVKEELYRKHIEGRYEVAWVVDDRLRVVRKWRELGLTCFAVAEGNF
jgi:hypothetical protein